jgi:hypothetical protein
MLVTNPLLIANHFMASDNQSMFKVVHARPVASRAAWTSSTTRAGTSGLDRNETSQKN